MELKNNLKSSFPALHDKSGMYHPDCVSIYDAAENSIGAVSKDISLLRAENFILNAHQKSILAQRKLIFDERSRNKIFCQGEAMSFETIPK